MEGVLGYIVAGRYQLEKKIGKGSFGEIFQANDIIDKKKVGVKAEAGNLEYPQLVNECKIYDLLRGGPGIPYLYWYGYDFGYNFLVIDLLGLSLDALFENCGHKFSLKTVLQLADQMISRIEYLHSQYYIHRDIKPENFVIGTEERSNFVYVIDFGLCKKYMDRRTGHHIPLIEGKSLTGTARYVSINTHLGIEQSRRDDLEGLGYVFVLFLKGKLPWQDTKNIPGNPENKLERYEFIKNLKISTSGGDLCEDLPIEFKQYMDYVRSLKFEQTPDYTYLKNLFKNLMYKHRYDYDYQFDWKLTIDNNSPK
jgi:serine/threonine protein kinase